MATASVSRIESIGDGRFPEGVYRNPGLGKIYQLGVEFDHALITNSGALTAVSGAKTGRCPNDKRVVDQPSVHQDVWWGSVNIPFSEESFEKARKLAIEFLDEAPNLYVIDGFAGWDLAHRIKVRIICSRPYHALFMHNMLIRPTAAELQSFGTPDYIIYNAGQRRAEKSIPGVTSETSVSINFESGEMVILGTEYAGEMKKGVFTIMNYLMPKKGVLSMHCSANEGAENDVTLFFGLSGTGKTTLSADPLRRLIGDDEHVWTENGIFNIEGGCYAKCINLSAEKEPEIFNAIRFGAILENTVVNEFTHEPDFDDDSITQNTRCSYPIENIVNAKIPCVGGHPKNIILLTCDAFGVLPPVSKLTPEQAMYHFISGYTAKVAGTEVGVVEPEATFSACYGAAFLVWHPIKYAEMLAELMRKHSANAWLINTGWSGGSYHGGNRIKLKFTRAIIDAIHRGTLIESKWETEPYFGLTIPKSCINVPSEILNPENTWADNGEFKKTASTLASKFHKNFEKFADHASPEIKAAGPRNPG
ncbi:MAG TPA: phosphoenolpyruvate carboxykinase (ATP) [Pirellulaceae bacterium]|nr:phosphoenolpyruvate carboxykinase (ATP) [Pirellulaceae bacterium]HMO93492.1 phosphoenolpyruvate carboxykinase (ATP) [Pirellulaceae bacterium]HMP70397.1 phosphoenolpyruvate carboxykinase (ATP) [Pirellulaceae bacterium]